MRVGTVFVYNNIIFSAKLFPNLYDIGSHQEVGKVEKKTADT